MGGAPHILTDVTRFFERIGLGRRDLRAWALYDTGNSAFQTTIIAAVFPIYYRRVAAAGLPEAEAMSRFAWATAIAILIVAIVAPVLGAIADHSALKKKMLAAFASLGIAAACAMFWVTEGEWLFALILIVTEGGRPSEGDVLGSAGLDPVPV